MVDISHERQITNKLLLDHLDMWDEFLIKSSNDPLTIKYYNFLENHLQNQIDASIRWLESSEGKKYLSEESEYKNEVFRNLEDDWDDILSTKYPDAKALLSEVYRRGKAKGYQDMQERIQYTESDKLALDFVTNYNFGLITKIDDDIRTQIKNHITSGLISGEGPYEIASKILNVTNQQLDGSTFTPHQRAVMIARTELSRVQNTGILQSYVNEGFSEVKILTAEDNDVCTTCLNYAYEFNKKDEIIYKNAGDEKIHNIIDLIKGRKFPPFHPNCRCTYLCVMESKGKGNLPDDFKFMNITPENSDFFDRYKAPEGTKPIVIDEKILEKELKGIIDDDEIPTVLKLFKKFNDTTFNCDYEWILGLTDKGFSPKLARTDWKKTYVYLHNALRNLKDSEKLLMVVHNHIWGMTPLPSEKDLKLYLNNNIKYGVSTNEMGLFIIKNKNKNKLSNEEMNKLLDKLMEFDKSIIDNFQNSINIIYDSENDNHKYLLNEYLKDNFDEWVNNYEIILSEYNMDIKFINAKKYNKY